MTLVPQPSTNARWRLASVKIRSFRGVADELTYEFDGRSGLLHGDNGAGKSTVAQSIQWTLYGKFPSEVLSNTSHKTFLAPVSAKNDDWFGQVTLKSGEQTLVITRDQGTREFSLELGDKTSTGDEAEVERDKLLGLDMAGFVRTVLLHQSRIRGLLLDSPKERNAALDRLLGMDDIEQILSRLKPRDFLKAAESRRTRIAEDERSYHSKEELLVKQRDDAHTQARTHKFLSKDFTKAGLKNAYASVAEQLSRLANEYEVELSPLSDCTEVDLADGISFEVAEALRTVRTKSKLQARLTPLNNSLVNYATLGKSMSEAFAERAGIETRKSAWATDHGPHPALVEKRSAAEKTLGARRQALKAAGQLRQLLAEGKGYIEVEPSEHCPLCEQSVASAAALISDLSSRLEALASKEASELEGQVVSAAQALEQLDATLKEFDEREEELHSAQDSLDKAREAIVESLGGAGIPEGKVESRLAGAVKELNKEYQDVSKGAEAMEGELSEVEAADRRIREGLVPVLRKRKELAALEDAWVETQMSHRQDYEAAVNLESTADQLAMLRTVLLEAKNELATTTLEQASPRANELYQTLVRHPVFDTLTLATAPKANKLDYSFEVSSGKDKHTAREARMVLSDGQVTATAIGLFFAFSDAETHNLDLLYVDDPTQNLDVSCKEAMAKVVTKIAKQRQVIVSTHDEDFVSYLESEGFFGVAVVHHLQRWDGNPTVKTKMSG